MSRIIRHIATHGRMVEGVQPLASEFVRPAAQLGDRIVTTADDVAAGSVHAHFSGLEYRPFRNLFVLARRFENFGVGLHVQPATWRTSKERYTVPTKTRIRPDQIHGKAKGYNVWIGHFKTLNELTVSKRHKDIWRLYEAPLFQDIADLNLPKPTWLEADGVVPIAKDHKKQMDALQKQLVASIPTNRTLALENYAKLSSAAPVEIPGL